MEESEKTWESPPLAISTASSKNRIYNALMKSDSVKPQENLFEVSERMVQREKENSKKALEELWLLKKTSREKDIKTLDMLIDYYQKKVDSVRQKEERLRSIGQESQKLIDDKKKLQQEIASITQEVEDCVQEIKFLNAKQDKLRSKEKDLKEKNDSVLDKLQNHEREVLDSLQTVILTRLSEAQAAAGTLPEAVTLTLSRTADTDAAGIAAPVAEATGPHEPDSKDVLAETQTEALPESVYKAYKPADHSRFPKSIVKTDKGRILGEYYYDPKVYKNSRSYVFNGRYFIDQIRKGLDLYRIDETNQTILNDFILMTSDILNRIQSRGNIHFEVATNEILNLAALTELIENIKARELKQIENLCNRYTKKLEMLGQNHELMMAEQLSSLTTKPPANAS
ncbi:MAG: hypothetical protein V1913_14720 [Fibrobacterota bacterium]